MAQTFIGDIVIETTKELEQLTNEYRDYIANGNFKSIKDVMPFKQFVENKFK
jgi:hypothetical protein